MSIVVELSELMNKDTKIIVLGANKYRELISSMTPMGGYPPTELVNSRRPSFDGVQIVVDAFDSDAFEVY